jgi:hypothetical protein
MSAHEPLLLPQNNDPLNQAALKWLKEAKGADPVPHALHVLSLMGWGLDNGAEGEWPARDRPALELQVGSLLGWKPENAMAFILYNPEGDDPEQQKRDLVGGSCCRKARTRRRRFS